MGINLEYPSGATPLDPDEAQGLIPGHITTQAQLNRWELQNVAAGEAWALEQKKHDILSFDFMKKLHKRMFGRTWRWAGAKRKTEKSIGIAPEAIEVEIKKLCDDVKAQLEYKSYPIEEIAARFHHRLVLIHPFPNGNGRFTRLMADLLLLQNGVERFRWGSDALNADGEIRASYIAALRAADGKDYRPLFQFLKVTEPKA